MFKKAPKRIPRKIGHDGDDPDPETTESSVVIKRPASSKTKSRQSTAVRTSLTAQEHDDQNVSIAARKVGLNRTALERAAAERLPIREASLDAYNANYLEELRSATPNRPAAAANRRWEENNNSLDSDAGETPTKSSVTFDLTRHDEDAPSAIPSAAEIEEKKARRRRLALEERAGDQEEDYISLDDRSSSRRAQHDSDSEGDAGARSRSLIIPADEFDPKSKWGETRLEHDDEDLAEGFDEFVDDPGRVVMGRLGLEEQKQARKREIQRQLRNAQRSDPSGQDEDDDDNEDDQDDDVARVRAYEAAQTKRGTVSGGAHLSSRQREQKREERLRKRLLNLPKPRPLPEMATVLAEFRAMVTESQEEEERLSKKEAELAREKNEVEREEIRIKALLKEAGEKFEQLKGASIDMAQGVGGSATQTPQEQERGLESLGSIPVVSEQ